MKLLKQAAASRYITSLGGQITRQAIHQWTKEIPLPGFFHYNEGHLMIDVNDREFQRRAMQSTVRKKTRIVTYENSEQIKKLIEKKKTEKPPEEVEEKKVEEEPFKPIVKTKEEKNIENMELRAYMADLQSRVYTSAIKEEQAKQEELKTAQMKKELAPMSLMKYFFSFAEAIVQRNYRRVEELSPELESLFLAGKKREAVKLLLREQENIADEASRELIKEIQEEGLKYEAD